MTHHLANAFSELGHDVWVLAPIGSVAGDKAAYELIVDHNPPPQPVEGEAWRTGELPRLMNVLSRLHAEHQFDQFLAMHASAYGQAMSAMARSDRPPVSTYFHGFELKSQLYFWKRVQAFRQRRAGHRPPLRDETLRTARTSDTVFTNSNYTARILKKAGRPKCDIVGCGVPKRYLEACLTALPNFSRAKKAELRAQLGLNPDTPLIGYVGRLVASKGIASIIEAMAHIKGANCLIIGDGPDRSRLENLANTLGISDRVKFTGSIVSQEKWAHLRALDVFCLLSQLGRGGEMEGFGIAALEASAAGTPCIVSNCGGLSEAILDQQTGRVIRSRDPARIAAVITSLLTDDELSASLVSQARRRIKTEQTWHHVAERMIRVWTP